MMDTRTLDLDKCRLISQTCSLSNVRKASRALTQVFDEMMRPLGLYATQYTVLIALAVSGDVPITPLAKGLGMDRTTLARNLDPLVRDGLAEVTPGHDQRTRIVRLTERGREKVQQGIPIWEQGQALVTEALGNDQWALLLGGLQTLVTRFKG